MYRSPLSMNKTGGTETSKLRNLNKMKDALQPLNEQMGKTHGISQLTRHVNHVRKCNRDSHIGALFHSTTH